MRYAIPIMCLFGAVGILAFALVIAAWKSTHHYSQYRELVLRGAVVEAAVPPRHANDPVTADGSYDIHAMVNEMGAAANGAIVVGCVAAMMMSLIGAVWYISWPALKSSEERLSEDAEPT